MIPTPVWVVAALVFAWWYVFKRGKGGGKKSLKRTRKEDEYYRRQLSIAKNKAKLEEYEQKKRKRPL
jgi:hypothetical protein